MSNILKSTKLDIALVKPYFKTICFTLLLPIVFAAINRSLLTGVKQIVLKYGFTNAISNFVDFKILLIIVTYKEYLYSSKS